MQFLAEAQFYEDAIADTFVMGNRFDIFAIKIWRDAGVV
jgi:hypothetical protein